MQKIHPKTHLKLAEAIVDQGGALLSEYSQNDRVFPSNFLARNRIVSGLSDGVLIIEASARSGTLATARFALEQGKPVMAVPGNITSPMSEGCNKLIKTGAVPVTAVDDVLQELGLTEVGKQTALPLAYSAEEQAIIDQLAKGVRDGETIQKESGLSPALFNQTLTMLEIEGKVCALGANQWSLK